MKPACGIRFIHSHLNRDDAIDDSGENRAVCEITRVADDIVWYAVLDRNGTAISREWCEVSRFPEIVAQAA